MNRVARVKRVASTLMDQVLRLCILEGMAHVTPFTWANRGTQGLAVASAWFVKHGIPMEPEWFSRENSQFYSYLMKIALRYTRNKETAEDIVSSILSGESRSDNVLGGQLHDVGKKMRVMDNFSLKKAKSMMATHVMHRSFGETGRPKAISLTEEDPESGAVVVKDFPTQEIGVDELVDQILQVLKSPEGRDLYKIIKDKMSRVWGGSESKLEILDYMIKYPEARDVQLANMIRPDGSWVQDGAATYVSKTRREIKQKLPEIIKNTPGLLKEIEMMEELSSLGYGASPSRFASRSLSRMVRAFLVQSGVLVS